MAMAVILTVSLLITCQKEGDETIATDNEVAFAINISHSKSASMLKSAMAYNLSDVEKIILTIQNSDGSPTKYTSSEVKVQHMNGSYFTQKIVLKTGTYKLTEFVVLDASGNTIFATPLTGFQEAQNVSNPLPIVFSISKNTSNPINVEVLSTENKKPEDFGLNHFPLIEVKTFSFLIGVVDNDSNKLLAAKLTVGNGSYSYIQNLDSVLNNVVTIKDGLSNYTLTLEKSGYTTYTHTYPIDSMKMYKNAVGSLPILVELKKNSIPTEGLVAYYPFNGNANDESGNGNNGIVNGALLTTDRFNNSNKAFYFDGVDNSIQIPSSSFNSVKGTISIWFKIGGTPNSETMLISLTNFNETNLNEFYLGFDQRWDSGDREEIEVILYLNNSTSWFIQVPIEQFNCNENFNWNFLTLVHNGIQPKLFLNGQEVGNYHPAHNDYSRWWSDIINAQEPAYYTSIGGINRSGGSFRFNGIIDDICIYNRELNEKEIQTLYNVR